MNKESCTYWIKIYWLGTMMQMLVVCGVLFLRKAAD